MYKIPANTLFLGKRLIYVPECPSTNDLAAKHLDDDDALPEGAVFITNNQTQGRGQKGNQWESHPGKNLTFSFVLKPSFLQPIHQFRLTQCISLGIRELVLQYTRESVWIKWPNDMYVSDRKLCGILIENQIRGNQFTNAIVGIGLNVNQVMFTAPKATSLAHLNSGSLNLDIILSQLLGCIERWYLVARKATGVAILESAYLDALYRRGIKHRFRANTAEFEGTITGIDSYGRLVVEQGGIPSTFDVRDITYLD